MKSTSNKLDLRNRENLGKLDKKSGIVAKTLLALSTVFVLGQQPAKADMISPTGMNMVTSPVYSFLSINIYHPLLWGDLDDIKDPKLKRTINMTKNILLKFNINDKLALQDFLELFSKLHSKKIKTFDFIDDFIKLGQKYHLSSDETIELFIKFKEKNFFPSYFFDNFYDKVQSNFTTLNDFYKDRTDDKINALIKIYKKTGTISQQDLKNVIPELLKYKERQEKELGKVALYLLLSVFGFIVISVAGNMITKNDSILNKKFLK